MAEKTIQNLNARTKQFYLNTKTADNIQLIKQKEINITNTEVITRFKKINLHLDESYFDNILHTNYQRIYNAVEQTEHKNKNKNILMYGRVQSGKTNNTLLTAEVLCEFGYDIIFLLGGTKVDLLHQNSDRFADYKEAFRYSNGLVFKDIKVENGAEEIKGLLNRMYYEKELNENLKLFIPILKNATWLKTTIDLFQQLPYIKNMKMAILDDESDEASTDIGNQNDESDVRIISSQIDELLSLANSYRYIAITATPNYNLLKTNLDSQRYINYIVPLENQDTYYGFKRFHMESDDHIEIISNSWSDEKAMTNFLDKTFEIAKEVMLDPKLQNEKFTILINNDSKKTSHSKDHNIVKKWKESFKQSINVNDKDLIDNFSVRVLNSDEQEYLKTNKKFNIIIGGYALSRGITFDNLIAELILNFSDSSTSSTMTQRCRWFGYREKTFKYTKIFLTEKLNQLYKNLGEIEEEFFKILADGAVYDENVKNYYKRLHEERKVDL
jgi:hypothetical protein